MAAINLGFYCSSFWQAFITSNWNSPGTLHWVRVCIVTLWMHIWLFLLCHRYLNIHILQIDRRLIAGYNQSSSSGFDRRNGCASGRVNAAKGPYQNAWSSLRVACTVCKIISYTCVWYVCVDLRKGFKCRFYVKINQMLSGSTLSYIHVYGVLWSKVLFLHYCPT